MPPKIEFLSPELIQKVLEEAFYLLKNTGVKVQSPSARQMLAESGAMVDNHEEIVTLPEEVVQNALKTVPHEFWLYTRSGEALFHYGGDAVHFDPGSC